MNNKLKKILPNLILIGPITLFFFIKWYWVLLLYNILFSLFGYITWAAMKNKQTNIGVVQAIVFPLLFNVVGLLYIVFVMAAADEKEEKEKLINQYENIEKLKTIAKMNLGGFEYINKNEVEINWLYGIDKAFDFNEKRFEKNLIFYKYEEKEGGNCHVVFKGVESELEAKKFIDLIISQNGGMANFKKLNDVNHYKYIYRGDLFEISYFNTTGTGWDVDYAVEIEKVEKFTIVDKSLKDGINENDIKIRKMINGLDKILYNEGEGPSNGRLCVRQDTDSSFVFAYFDELNESLDLFKKIVINYERDHQVFQKSSKILDELINSGGIIFKNDLFRLQLIRENVKYKFYITAPKGFYNKLLDLD